MEGNAERLPFEDESVDVYTIAFGLRNVTNTLAALRTRRLNLEGVSCAWVSHVKAEPLEPLRGVFVQRDPRAGQAVARDRASYQYLVESIRKFPRQEELAEMMIDAGSSL